MYSVEVPVIINWALRSFYRVGLWHRGDEATVCETIIKLFYSIYHVLFPLSLFARAFSTDKDESIFLTEMGLVFSVLTFKLFHIIWGKREICTFVDRIGVYSLDDFDQFTLANGTMQSFNKITKFFIFIIYLTNTLAVLIVPFLGSEKKLFFNIAFPLDFSSNEFAFWLAFVFLSSEIILSCIAFLFSAFTWYLMITCTLKYEVLGLYIKNIGVRKAVYKSKAEKENLFLQDLITACNSYTDIKRYQKVTIMTTWIKNFHFLLPDQ